jgi:hypothetical protein
VHYKYYVQIQIQHEVLMLVMLEAITFPMCFGIRKTNLITHAKGDVN